MRSMGYETFITICYVTAAISVALGAVGVFLFFKLKIKNVIGDLTGINRKKSIENIKAQNKNNTRKTTASKYSASQKGTGADSQSKTRTKAVTNSNKQAAPSKVVANKSAAGVASSESPVSEKRENNVSQKRYYGTDNLDVQETYEDDSVTSVLGVQETYEDDSVTSVLGVQETYEDGGVTSVLGVENLKDERKNETSVLNSQSTDGDDGIKFIHGQTL